MRQVIPTVTELNDYFLHEIERPYGKNELRHAAEGSTKS
jgi:hypothetical protein